MTAYHVVSPRVNHTFLRGSPTSGNTELVVQTPSLASQSRIPDAFMRPPRLTCISGGGTDCTLPGSALS